MKEVFNEIVYSIGFFTIIAIAIFLLAGVVLSIKEITYDARKNSAELQEIKSRSRRLKRKIEEDNVYTAEDVLDIIDCVVGAGEFLEENEGGKHD